MPGLLPTSDRKHGTSSKKNSTSCSRICSRVQPATQICTKKVLPNFCRTAANPRPSDGRGIKGLGGVRGNVIDARNESHIWSLSYPPKVWRTLLHDRAGLVLCAPAAVAAIPEGIASFSGAQSSSSARKSRIWAAQSGISALRGHYKRTPSFRPCVCSQPGLQWPP